VLPGQRRADQTQRGWLITPETGQSRGQPAGGRR